MKTGIGKAHGKIIFMGEHSVVYGYPAIALPFRAVEMTAKITPSDYSTTLDSDLYQGDLLSCPPHLTNIKLLIEKLMMDYLPNQHTHVQVTSSIPAERGMGSSASVACAIIRAFFDYLDQPIATDTLLKYADFAEEISHGNPSGLDARLTALDQPLLYRKNEPITPFHFQTPYWLVVADTGIPGETKAAVAAVREGVDQEKMTENQPFSDALHHLGKLVTKLRACLVDTQAHNRYAELSSLINQAQQDLKTLTVSSHALDQGISYCQTHHVPAKLTGGGRGGCYLALANNKAQAEQRVQQLENNGLAIKTWLMPFAS